MSHEEPPQPDGETSDEQHNSSDGANATRKGQPWSEEEHLAFLQGLRFLGKGNWRAIARQYIPTRTATQVASHAQKHFMRVAGTTKRKSRFTALEVEVEAPTKQLPTSRGVELIPSQPCREQPSSSAPVLQPATAFAGVSPFPAFSAFPFMNPLMFGFPGPFVPPFMCPPPPAFAAAAMSSMQKQGPTSPSMLPFLFPLAAMNPFYMAQQMAVAAQAAVANRTAAPHAATSGGGTTAGTAPAATIDTANSDEMPRRTQSAAPGSPAICKPEAQHARIAAAAPAAAAVTAAGAVVAVPCVVIGNSASAGAAPGTSWEGGAAQDRPQGGTTRRTERGALPLMVGPPAGPRPQEDGAASFHTSTPSAFRPPQDLKTEN